MNLTEADERSQKIKLLMSVVSEVVIQSGIVVDPATDEFISGLVEHAHCLNNQWANLSRTVAEDIARNASQMKAVVETATHYRSLLKGVLSEMNSIDLKKMTEFVSLCDRIDQHAKSGVLSAMMNLTKPL